MPAISMELSPAPHPWLEEESTDLFWSSCLGSSSRSSSPLIFAALHWDALAQTQTGQWYQLMVGTSLQHPAPLCCWPLETLQNQACKSCIKKKKKPRNLCYEQKMALKPHLARDQIEEEPCSTRDKAEGITQLSKATFAAKSHQNQGYRGSSSPSAQGSAKPEHNSECSHAEKPLTRRKMQLHSNLLGKFIVDNLNTLQNVVCRMHPLIGLHRAVIN